MKPDERKRRDRELIPELRKQFNEMMASKGQPDHEDILHDYQCFALNMTPALLDAADECDRLREVVEAAKAFLAWPGEGPENDLVEVECRECGVEVCWHRNDTESCLCAECAASPLRAALARLEKP